MHAMSSGDPISIMVREINQYSINLKGTHDIRIRSQGPNYGKSARETPGDRSIFDRITPCNCGLNKFSEPYLLHVFHELSACQYQSRILQTMSLSTRNQCSGVATFHVGRETIQARQHTRACPGATNALGVRYPHRILNISRSVAGLVGHPVSYLSRFR